MSISTLARLALVLMLVPWLARCDNGGGGGGTDSAMDTVGDTFTDTAVDVPPDTPTDTTTDPGTAWNWCAKNCSVADDCCLR